MKKHRPNRMLKEDRVERLQGEIEEPAVEEPQKDVQEEEARKEVEEEAPEVDGMKCYPCKFCGGETSVIKSWPAMYTTQEPVKVVKYRQRRCLKCYRTFKSQELTLQETGEKVQI
jgi:hypothetical protein